MGKYLQHFIYYYYDDIAKKIEQQQVDYGLARIHSHRHISRCIIYSDWFCDILNIPKDSIERLKLYLAISLHDIGREGELEDVWESKSKYIYKEYVSNIVDKNDVNKEGLLIDYENDKILSDIIHDVDCLDIMRYGTGRGGIMGFDKKYLRLMKDNPYLQDTFISTAWQLINYTDDINFDNIKCLKDIYLKNTCEWKIGI
jgi:hypothetical protein